MSEPKLNSSNPVFVNFNALTKDVKVMLGAVEQKGADVLEKLGEPDGARMGYGVGFVGNPNVKWDGPDIPFNTPYGNIPWGKAILCSAVKAPAEGSTPATITLTPVDATNVHGTCYGLTIKDCSVQLNAGISVGENATIAAADTLVVAICANVSLSGDGVLVDSGETVVAISEAIDPTVFNAPNGMQFVIPKAVGGYTFTVRGNFLHAPGMWRRASVYTSLKDQISSYPTSQAILAAKVNS